MMRVFIALDIPADVRFHLGLLAGGVPGARWVPQENYHITLRFLGDMEEPMLDQIDEALTAIKVPAFSLVLQGVGQFGGDKTHALWVGVHVNPELTHLKSKIETALQRMGLPPDDRKYTPHVTLARLKNAPMDKVTAFLSHHALFRTQSISITHFTLYSSHTGGEASIYTPLQRYGLE